MSPVTLGLIIALASVCLLIFFVLITAYITYRMAFYKNPKKEISDPYRHVKNDGSPESEFSKELIDRVIALPYENIYTTSHDGLKLRARLYMTDPEAPFAIQFHGYKSTPMLDFSGGGPFAMSLGFNVIMVDQRANGESGGRTITFGVCESLDAMAWIKYVGEQWGKDRKIILFGVSMGGATVIMRAGMGVPDNVVGAVADCPCSSAKEIITKVIYDMKLPGKLLYPFVRLGGKIFGGFDANLAEPRELIEKTKIPILIIHGEADKFVPCAMSVDMAERSDLAELYTFPGAKHGTSFIVDQDRYKAISKEFIYRCLKTEKLINDN